MGNCLAKVGGGEQKKLNLDPAKFFFMNSYGVNWHGVAPEINWALSEVRHSFLFAIQQKIDP